jgi:F-box protein 21
MCPNYVVFPQSWVLQMGVNKLPLADQQPFYNVLVSDGSERYAAEENLEPILKTDENAVSHITHPQIGRFFEGFDGKRYLPNHHLAVIYPEDAQYVHRFFSRN